LLSESLNQRFMLDRCKYAANLMQLRSFLLRPKIALALGVWGGRGRALVAAHYSSAFDSNFKIW
jgi:hypothetical protein